MSVDKLDNFFDEFVREAKILGWALDGAPPPPVSAAVSAASAPGKCRLAAPGATRETPRSRGAPRRDPEPRRAAGRERLQRHRPLARRLRKLDERRLRAGGVPGRARVHARGARALGRHGPTDARSKPRLPRASGKASWASRFGSGRSGWSSSCARSCLRPARLSPTSILKTRASRPEPRFGTRSKRIGSTAGRRGSSTWRHAMSSPGRRSPTTTLIWRGR